MTTDRLNALVNAWLDGAMTDGDQAELECSLLTDSTAREQFWAMASLHGILAEVIPYRQSVPPPADSTGDGQSAGQPGSTAASSQPVGQQGIVALPQSLVDWLTSIQFGSTRLIVVCVAMGMGVYFASLLLSIAWQRTWQAEKNSTPLARFEPGNTPRLEANAARLVSATDCRWQENVSPPMIGDQLKAGWLHLTQGSVEIEFAGGATVKFSGPADFELISPAQGFLSEGKLSAYVPQRARNFVIETPTARVVDLGTAFVVEVDRAAQTTLAVIEGVVEVLPAQESADGRRSYLDDGHKQRLTLGQAMKVTRTSSGSVVAAAEHFDINWVRRTAPAGATAAVTSLPASAASQGEGEYSRAVLGTPGLLAYWKLGEAGGSTARDEVGRDLSQWGITAGTYRNLSAQQFGQPGALAEKQNAAVHFNGIDSYVDLGSSASLNGAWEGLTITAWINPDRITPQSLIVGRWAMQVPGDQFGLFVNGGKPLIVVADGLQIADGMKAEQVEVVAHRWNFVVGTWNARSRTYHLYVDGQRDSASGTSPARINPNSTARATIGGQASTNTRFFSGLIDEVALFDRELSADEISELYRLRTASESTTQ